jgi:hypothetical protein
MMSQPRSRENPFRLSPLAVDFIVIGVLFAAVAVLYAPSLKYPFVWYDADDLLRAAKYSTLNLFTGVANYQYYRPLIFLLWKAILYTWGGDSAPIFHAYLIGGHFLNSVLLFALARDLTRRRSIAAATALLFAVYPFSYQAVTWVIAHQPPSMILVLGGLLIYTRARLRSMNGARSGASRWQQPAAIVCLIAAMLMHESAFVAVGLIILIEAYLVVTRRVARPSMWPLAYIAVTVIMFVIYSAAAKSSLSQSTFETLTGLYLLQGLVYPAAMILADSCRSPVCDSSAWLPLAIIASLIILLVVWRANRTTWIGLLGILWFITGALPMWAERDYVYNEYAPRLLYLAGAGAALAIGAILGGSGQSSGRPWRSPGFIARAGVIALILLQSGQFVMVRQSLYDSAFRLLAQENDAMFVPRSGHALFINTVELFSYKTAEFPLGWFGVLASPWHNRIAVDRDLRARNADWLVDPGQAQTIQDNSRLALEFHGQIASPEELQQTVLSSTNIYRVAAVEGNLHLFEIGSTDHTSTSTDSYLASWGQSIRLITATISIEAGVPVLELDWSIDSALDSNQTVFVHVQDASGQIVAQADGDLIGGYVPIGLWPPGMIVDDRRPLIRSGGFASGQYTIALGLYDRGSLQRAIPTAVNNAMVQDDAVLATSFDIR